MSSDGVAIGIVVIALLILIPGIWAILLIPFLVLMLWGLGGGGQR